MSGIRPPLMSQGQADDFYAYMSLGTGLMWLAGGLAAGPALATVAACGLGAVVNHASSGNGGRLNYVPDQPPDRPQLHAGQTGTIEEHEQRLEKEFGVNAVYAYRAALAEAKVKAGDNLVAIVPIFERLRSLLQELKRRGLWHDGRLQAKPGTTPQEAFEKSNKKRDKRRRKMMEKDGLFGNPNVPHSGDAGNFFAGILASLDETSAAPLWRSACKWDPLRGHDRRGKWTHRRKLRMVQGWTLDQRREGCLRWTIMHGSGRPVATG